MLSIDIRCWLNAFLNLSPGVKPPEELEVLPVLLPAGYMFTIINNNWLKVFINPMKLAKAFKKTNASGNKDLLTINT